MKLNLLIMCLASVSDIVHLGDLTIDLQLTRHAGALTYFKTNVSCKPDEYGGVRKSDLKRPINYLERSSFILDFKNGCSVVAAWKASMP
ncbi:hypothetical protein N7537_001512 [Penicillium hordei]|uniref:Uncharacterized protein n=1 Tax=Penicillium hordei TaxID=40994 RepID=A0AAD6EFN4_9EURO|nr:uncharacterized protein N7537_001512 [Penicillium hordei]KAJ5616398.1 hypothetical protein N7537_001512 [Penicillium hordei]